MKKSAQKNILFLFVASRLGGGERMLLNIIDNLDREKFKPVVILPSDGPIKDELAKRGIKFGVISNSKNYSKFWPFAFIGQVFKMIYWIIKEDIDLLHANGVEVYRAAGIAARLTHRKIVCHLHAQTNDEDFRYAFINYPDTIIACCEDIAKDVRAFLPAVPRKTSVRSVVNSIDITRYKSDECHPRESGGPLASLLDSRFRGNDSGAGVTPSNFVVTTIGDLSEGKGGRYFLQMAQGVLRQFPKTQFLMIGKEKKSDQGFEQVLKDLAEELGISDSVKFIGFTDKVMDYLNASDIFVLPSLTEGLPLVILEAMACAKPVVATDVNGIPELIQDGVTGFMVKPKDTDSLTASVLKILQDSKLRLDMGTKGRERVEKFFNFKRYMSQLEGIYADILKKNEINSVLRHRRLTQFAALFIQKVFYRHQEIADKTKVRKILVILLDYIGDGVLSESVFPVLHENFPQASITVMVGSWTKDLYKSHPLVKNTIVYNCDWVNRTGDQWSLKEKWNVLTQAREEKFDLIVDIRGSLGTLLLGFWKASPYRVDQRVFSAGEFIKEVKRKFFQCVSLRGAERRSNLTSNMKDCFVAKNAPRNDTRTKGIAPEDTRRTMMAVNILKELGITPPTSPTVSVHVPKEDREFLKAMLIKEGVDIRKNIISIHPGVNSRFKKWLPERWAEVADRLIEQYHVQVVISGGKSDCMSAQDILNHMKNKAFDLTGKMSLMEMAALIELSQMCICLDSGPMHIAGGLNVPVIGLFGANHPDTCAPWTKCSKLLYHHLPCSDICTETEEMGCDTECMKEISVEEVFTAAREYLI